MPERARTDPWEPQGSNPLGPPGQPFEGERISPESSVIYNPEGKISQEKLENPAGFWNNVEENTVSLFQNKGAFE
jgi:hypothetical protein